MNNKTTVITVLIITIIGSYYWFSLDNNSTNENVGSLKEEVDELPELDRIVLNFLDKYDVNTEIPNNLNYTFQFEEAYINTGKPIIFTGILDDILRKNNEIYLRFTPAFFDFSNIKEFYTLHGCNDKIDGIINREHTAFDEYVVVANITSVKKPVVGINGFPINEDEVELEFEQANSIFIEGECIDLEYLKDGSYLF